MPAIAETWFQRNFGLVPDSFTRSRGGLTADEQARVTGRPVPMARESTPYFIPDSPFDSPLTRRADGKDIIEGWREANAAMMRNQGRVEQTASNRVSEQQRNMAMVRARLRSALEQARTTRQVIIDDSKLKYDVAAAASGQVMITPSNVKTDLGRDLTNNDQFFTGRYQYDTRPVLGQARNRYEAMLDSRVQGQTVTRTPIMSQPQYRDAAGEAMLYAQNRRMTQAQIEQWQRFFMLKARAGGSGLVPGQFQFGVWDSATQKAMYDQMGEANAQGNTVESVKAGIENTLKQLGFDYNGGSGPGGGGGGAARPTTTTQTIYSITSLAKGGEILKAYLQQELGRDPSKAEVAAYVRLLNGQERKNPTVVTTHYSASGASSTSTTKEGNVDAGATADDYVGKNLQKELGARQTMEYMTALTGMD